MSQWIHFAFEAYCSVCVCYFHWHDNYPKATFYLVFWSVLILVRP